MSDRVVALARGSWEGSVATNVRVSYSALSGSQTPVSSNIGPVSVLQVPSGGLVVRRHASAEVGNLVRGAADFVQRVAAALPYSAEDDDLLSRHMAEQTRGLKITPLRRRLPDPR